MEQKQVLMRIVESGGNGREYVIYADGEIQGFAPDAVVFNYFPSIVDSCLADAAK